jgi:hypothetical protein
LDFWSGLDDTLSSDWSVFIFNFAEKTEERKEYYSICIFCSTLFKFLMVNNIFWHASAFGCFYRDSFLVGINSMVSS